MKHQKPNRTIHKSFKKKSTRGTLLSRVLLESSSCSNSKKYTTINLTIFVFIFALLKIENKIKSKKS